MNAGDKFRRTTRGRTAGLHDDLNSISPEQEVLFDIIHVYMEKTDSYIKALTEHVRKVIQTKDAVMELVVVRNEMLTRENKDIKRERDYYQGEVKRFRNIIRYVYNNTGCE